MSNTFVTPTVVVRDAGIIFMANAIIPRLISRDHEAEFVGKKAGSTIKVTYMSEQTAREFSTTTTEDNIVENEVSLTLEKHFYVKHILTSAESTLSIDDYSKKVTGPAIRALIKAADVYLAQIASEGYARNLVGTDGTAPSTIAHILAGRKQLQDNLAQTDQPIGLIGTAAEASFLALTQFTSKDYTRGTGGIEGAMLEKRFGINWFTDQNCTNHDRGDIAGTVLMKVQAEIGDTAIALKDFTAATGTVNAGTRFTIAGTGTVYTVTEDATLASNDADTVKVTPAMTAQEPIGDAITFKAAASQDMIYDKRSLIGAIIAPAPLKVGSSVSQQNGMGVRYTESSSTSTLTDDVVYDILIGARVMQPNGGVIFQG